jgi:hypothetical protein
LTRRRRTLEPLPPELLQFDGRQYTTTAEWGDAFEAFHEERERWWVEHGHRIEELPILPSLSGCPWDPDEI